MSNTKTPPIIAIVGRANVGKSTLFNRLTHSPRAIVAREAGTTRDNVTELVTTDEGLSFWLLDTAGLKKAVDDFELSIQEQINDAIEMADLVIQVVDGTTDITPEDRKVAKSLHKTDKPRVLALNKADKKTKFEDVHYRKLGHENIIRISAAHGINIEDLIEFISKNSKLIPFTKQSGIKVAFAGRPNVGKSSLFNKLSAKQQALVSDRAGTTRDAAFNTLKYNSQAITLIDTAGIRRQGKQEVGIEKFSVLRSLWAIEQSDVCFLVLDATELGTHLDQRLAGEIKNSGKGLIFVITKWDLIEKDSFTQNQFLAKLKTQFDFIAWAPVIFVSSESGQNVSSLFDLILEIDASRKTKLTTRHLNRLLKDALAAQPPRGLKKLEPKLRYITQTDSEPPEFTIFGSNTKAIHFSYIRFLERKIRETDPMIGTPIKIRLSDRDGDEKSKSTIRRNG